MKAFTTILALLSLLLTVSASTPPSFCKCTCFTNSTIIELTPQTSPAQRRTDQLAALRSILPPPLSAYLERRHLNSLPAAALTTLDTRSPMSQLLSPRADPSACSRCNRAFCLAQNLPICKGAAETDVATSCFQRDSAKDQVIVLGFIGLTVGLLGWAAGKRVLARRRAEMERGLYARVAEGGEGPQ